MWLAGHRELNVMAWFLLPFFLVQFIILCVKNPVKLRVLFQKHLCPDSIRDHPWHCPRVKTDGLHGGRVVTAALH